MCTTAIILNELDINVQLSFLATQNKHGNIQSSSRKHSMSLIPILLNDAHSGSATIRVGIKFDS